MVRTLEIYVYTKRNESKSPQEDIYKNIFYRFFFFFFKYPSELVIATLMSSANISRQQFRPSDSLYLHHLQAQKHVHVCHLQAAVFP